MTAPAAGASAVPGLLAMVEQGAMTIRSCDHLVVESDIVLGAVYGVVGPEEATAIVHRLRSADDPGAIAGDLPWAAVVRRYDGSVATTCSMMLTSGLFVTVSEPDGQPRWVIATDPGSALRARGAIAHIDPEYLRAYARGESSPRTTPYVGLRRVPAGETVVWRAGADASKPLGGAVTRPWCDPDTVPPPSVAGENAVVTYVDAFDAVVAELARRAGPLVATISGGLDSTFVAASLARGANSCNPVHGYCYSPLIGADLSDVMGRDGDDLPYALLMADRYPGLLSINPLRNEGRIRPLAAASAASQRSWLPTFAPGNRVWLDQFQARVSGHGPRLGFFGTHGNASFSFAHPYYVSPSLRVRRLAGRLRPGSSSRSGAGGIDRLRYLAWLTGRANGLAATGHPAATGGLLRADPFAARSIIELAASITPKTWQMGGPRGFARAACAGRVPDGIRLRTRRGAQASDCWFVVRDDRDEYLDRAGAVTGVPGLEEAGGHHLIREVAAWPWGEPLGPDPLSLARVHRVLALAEFATTAAARGRALEWSPD